jgi:hypothetical protein
LRDASSAYKLDKIDLSTLAEGPGRGHEEISMITILLLANILLTLFLLFRLRRTRYDLLTANFRVEVALARYAKARQKRLPLGIDGLPLPKVDAKPAPTHRRDSDDLPRTGRQTTGLKFEKRGGDGDRQPDDDQLHQDT